MTADEREEIAASVAAHAELGPRYEAAVAEGLVERIGEEIDRRVDARLRGMDQQTQAYPSPGQRAAPRPAAAPPDQPAHRNNGVTGMLLGVGSMGLGVGAAAVVVSNEHSGAAAVIMVLLIWFVIAIINIAHSQRR